MIELVSMEWFVNVDYSSKVHQHIAIHYTLSALFHCCLEHRIYQRFKSNPEISHLDERSSNASGSKCKFSAFDGIGNAPLKRATPFHRYRVFILHIR